MKQFLLRHAHWNSSAVPSSKEIRRRHILIDTITKVQQDLHPNTGVQVISLPLTPSVLPLTPRTLK